MPTDIFAPGTGYSYYFGDGTLFRKKAFQVPEALAEDFRWNRDERVDIAHDTTPVAEDEVAGITRRVYGEPPKGVLVFK